MLERAVGVAHRAHVDLGVHEVPVLAHEALAQLVALAPAREHLVEVPHVDLQIRLGRHLRPGLAQQLVPPVAQDLAQPVVHLQPAPAGG